MLGGDYVARSREATPTAETKKGKAESPQAMPFKSLDSSFRWNDGKFVVRRLG
jgi:hypothetical protein